MFTKYINIERGGVVSNVHFCFNPIKAHVASLMNKLDPYCIVLNTFKERLKIFMQTRYF